MFPSAQARRLLAGVVLLGLTQLSQALPGDRNKPIKITADTAARNERQGTTHYIGNVVLTQGSLVITANELSIETTDDNKADRIIATGEPATLAQTPEIGKAPVEATAGRIVYRQSDNEVTLTENARIEQDGATVTGAIINYLVNEQRVKATGDKGSADGKRVEVIIPPSALNNGDDNAPVEN